MVSLHCEICGGNLTAKSGGIFVCDNCGIQYDKVRIQEMLRQQQAQTESVSAARPESPNRKWLIPTLALVLSGVALAAFFLRSKPVNTPVTDISVMHTEAPAETLIPQTTEPTQPPLPEGPEKEAYQNALALEEAGNIGAAAMAFYAIRDYHDSYEKSFDLWDQIIQHQTLTATDNCTIGIMSDGTLKATGDNSSGQCNVAGWTNIISVSSNEAYLDDPHTAHTIGLKADRTVVCTGSNKHGETDVSQWSDIVQIDTGYYHSVGLRADGTVVATGNNRYGQCDVEQWDNIIAISAGDFTTVGLRADGKVVAVGANSSGQCNVTSWTDIVQISAAFDHTVGLKSDGTVVSVGDDYYGTISLPNKWTNIVAVVASQNSTTGLTSYGTVVNTLNQSKGIWPRFQEWRNVETIVTSNNVDVFAFTSDGQVLCQNGLMSDEWIGLKFPE